jgi:hypothetical protein
LQKNELHSRQSIFLEMFTLIQHILSDQEGECTRRVTRTVEEISCGLGYLKITLRHSLGRARRVTFRAEVTDGGTLCCWNNSHVEAYWQNTKRDKKQEEEAEEGMKKSMKRKLIRSERKKGWRIRRII